MVDFCCFNACATLLEALENGDTRGGGGGRGLGVGVGGSFWLSYLKMDAKMLREDCPADDGFKKGKKAAGRTRKSGLTADVSGVKDLDLTTICPPPRGKGLGVLRHEKER